MRRNTQQPQRRRLQSRSINRMEIPLTAQAASEIVTRTIERDPVARRDLVSLTNHNPSMLSNVWPSIAMASLRRAGLSLPTSTKLMSTMGAPAYV